MSRLPTARCLRCRQRKPLTEFHWRRSARPLSYCKDCQRRAARTAERHRRKDPAAAAQLRAADRTRQQRWRRLRGQSRSSAGGDTA